MFSTTELIGYLASALIVVSLAMRSVVRLRTISLVGSVTFVVYGLLIGSWPVVVSNAIIAGINVWYLRQELRRGGRDLGAVPIAADAPFLLDFLHSHERDIARSQPGFTRVDPEDVALLLTRDGLPAGAMVGRRTGPDGSVLDLRLDYVMAAYRDSRIGRWIYGAGAAALKDLGVREVVAHPATAGHRSYLLGVGFEPADEDRLVRRLP